MNNGNLDHVLLRTEHVDKNYPDGRVEALHDVTLSIRAGEYVAIMGPSGSGKSTLLNLLGALDRPTSGEVFFEGIPLRHMGNIDLFRSEKVGFVFQSFYLLPTLTALENVQIPMLEGPLRAGARQAKARQLLAAVGMSHRENHLPSKLSVGERQRVAIARALANNPSLLLADEPTGNLDSRTALEILDLFARLHNERHMTVVVVTHSPEVAQRAQRIIRLRDGQVVEDVSLPQANGAISAIVAMPVR